MPGIQAPGEVNILPPINAPAGGGSLSHLDAPGIARGQTVHVDD